MDYRYYKEGDDILRCHCEMDPEPESPIGEDGMVSTMLVWWNRYHLGNENPYSSPEDFLIQAVEAYAKNDKDYDRFDTFSNMDRIEFLKGKGYAIFPLYIYEHTGITIHMGEFGKAPGYPFSDRFDAGMAGFVFVKKDDFLEKTGADESSWREKAKECLKSEVELYDMYLRGEVYGIVVEEMEDDGEWYERESCWGYYSDSFGDDLVREIASDYIGDTYLTYEEAAAA